LIEGEGNVWNLLGSVSTCYWS